MLSTILFLPLGLGLLLLALRASSRKALGFAALAGSVVTFAVALVLYARFDFGLAGYQYEQSAPWIPTIGAEYHIGIDGISLGLVLLTTLLVPVVIWYLMLRLPESPGSLLFAILALESAVIGVLVSVDVLLFYVFWEAMLIPMYFLIAVWGGERRAHASLKFILYMMIGSLLMLVGVLWFYWWQHAHDPMLGPVTFNLVEWLKVNSNPTSRIPDSKQEWMFFFFFLSFAIKVPLFPLHTWLPDAQEQAPIAFNVLLIEVGAYGFIRFCLPLFPQASLHWAPVIMTLAVINIVYGAVMATVQRDLKRLLAYAGMSHAGFMMLGIYSMTVQGIQGGILYMISSGLTGGGLFLIVAMLEHRRARRGVDDFGGLAARMPLLFFLFMVMSLGAIGLPGLNGFPAEFLVITGAIRAGLGTHPIVSPWYGYLAGLGVVLSAVYMLWMFQRVMYGEAPEALRDSKDLDRGESFSLWPIVAAVFFIGIGSAVFTEPMLPAVQSTIESVQQGVPPEVVDVPGNDLTPEGSIP